MSNPTPPAVPERVRTVAYFLLLAGSALVLLAHGLAPIWFGEPLAGQIVQSAGVVTGVLGLIGGGLGVAYRPTHKPQGITLSTAAIDRVLADGGSGPVEIHVDGKRVKLDTADRLDP